MMNSWRNLWTALVIISLLVIFILISTSKRIDTRYWTMNEDDTCLTYSQQTVCAQEPMSPHTQRWVADQVRAGNWPAGKGVPRG